MRLSLLPLAACLGALALPTAARADWPTYHADQQRSGTDTSSGAALPVSAAWSSPDLGATMWGQPLVIGGRVLVATENDDVIALDEATGRPLWTVHVATPVPSGKLPCGDIAPTVGITSTPVIDAARGELFAVAETWDGAQAHHVLYGLALSDGHTLLSENVDPPGSTPLNQLQRPALGLSGGRVQIGFGGHDGDCAQYRGYLVSAPETGAPPAVWAAPTTREAAIWAGGAGPAVDAAGHVYAATGNGASTSTSNYDHGDTLEKWDAAANELDYFAPPTWATDSANDADLGSMGPLLLPGGWVYQGGKNGNGYLVNSAGMGHVDTAGTVFHAPVCDSYGGGAVGPALFYVPCSSGVRALKLGSGSFSVAWHGPSDANGSPIVAGGRLWVPATGSGKLYGLDPSTGAVLVTESTPAMEHFASPSASDGRVLLATGHTVEAWNVAQALSPAAPPPPAAAGAPPPTSVTRCAARVRIHLRGAARRVRITHGRHVVLARHGRALRTVSIRTPRVSERLTVTERTRRGELLRFRVKVRGCPLPGR